MKISIDIEEYFSFCVVGRKKTQLAQLTGGSRVGECGRLLTYLLTFTYVTFINVKRSKLTEKFRYVFQRTIRTINPVID